MSPTFLEDDTVAEVCPVCAGPVNYDLTCHTWGGTPDGKGWRVCMPCGSAYIFSCECGWSYTWGLNPRNPRSVSNERNRPEWIEQGSRPNL